MSKSGTSCPPLAQGLYRPHRRTRRVRRRLRRRHQGPTLARDRRAGRWRCSSTSEHRGACGCEANTGDGAGILIQMPDALPAQARCAWHSPAPAGRLRRRPGLPAARRSPTRIASRTLFERSSTKKGSACSAGATCPTDNALLGRDRPRAASRSSSSCSSAARHCDAGPRRSAALRAQALRHPQAHRARGRRADVAARARSFYMPACRRKTLIYKGMLTADQIAPMFPDLADPDCRVRAGARAPALQHEHVPVVAARAPVPAHRAQRRDQHAARQHQLDARARRAARVRAVRRRPRRRSCRSSAKAAATRRPSTTCSSSSCMAGRSLPHAIMMMIPEPWQQPRDDDAEREGVLRIPLVA